VILETPLKTPHWPSLDSRAMPNPSPAPRLSRRQLLVTGLAGGALLAGASWWAASRRDADATPVTGLSSAGQTLFGAVGPVILGPAWPGAAAQPQLLSAVGQAIAQLSPAAQAEIGQLVDLLSLPPARVALAGVWPSWDHAPTADIAAFLQRWRDSRLGLLQSGYHALHDLVLGAWYADPATWGALGYAGPPSLGERNGAPVEGRTA
jgi:hypothetical protein